MMTSQLKKALRRFSHGAGHSTPPAGPSCGIVGYQSDLQNGWFQSETGELAHGFRITSEDVVIDVGCGGGGISRFAVEMGAEVIATDVDPEAIRKTRKILETTGSTRFKVIQSDSAPLPVADATCSRVVALEVLEHVDAPEQFLAELIRVAKPNALFLLAVPDELSETIQQGLAPPSYWQKPNHLRIFGREELSNLVESAGLSVVHRECKSFFWAMWWTLFWAANQEFGEQEKPVLYHWTQTWHALMQSDQGKKIGKKLDELMPKSQVIVARKAAG